MGQVRPKSSRGPVPSTPDFSPTIAVDGITCGPYLLWALSKERFMRATSGIIIVALAVLALAGCSTTAADNTTYARPAASGGAVSIPLN